MKNKFRICSLITVVFLLILMDSCEKDDNVRLQFNPDLIYRTATDIDGNVYKTITIGTQTWMAENLKVSRYNDGTVISLFGEFWGEDPPGPAYCWLNDDPITYKNTYGAFYNWYAVNTGKLCPDGWHIPTISEWTTLVNYLGGDSIAGGKMKESGTKHWESPNLGATNESGFTALPIDSYMWNNHPPGKYCEFWSSSECVNTFAWNLLIEHNTSKVYWNISHAEEEFPVRCIKD